MAVADLPHGTEVPGRSRNATCRRPHNRLRHEGGDRVRTKALELGLQFLGQPRRELGLRLVIPLLVIGEGR